jgi:hypothetical protein
MELQRQILYNTVDKRYLPDIKLNLTHGAKKTKKFLPKRYLTAVTHGDQGLMGDTSQTRSMEKSEIDKSLYDPTPAHLEAQLEAHLESDLHQLDKDNNTRSIKSQLVQESPEKPIVEAHFGKSQSVLEDRQSRPLSAEPSNPKL